MSAYNGDTTPQIEDKEIIHLRKINALLKDGIKVRITGSDDGGSEDAQDAYLVPVASRMKKVSVEFSRPSDVNAYIAKDVIANSVGSPTVLTFANIALEAGAGGTITKARMFTDQKTFTQAIRLHLYCGLPTTPADNAPFLLIYGDFAKRIGSIDFPAAITEDPTNSTAAMAMVTPGSPAPGNVPLDFICDSGLTSIFGIVETLGGFTPASAQKFFFELFVHQG